MSISTARELFIDELKDIYSAEKQAVELLAETLQEEKDTDEKLTEISATANSDALEEGDEDEDEDDDSDEDEEDEDEEDEDEDEEEEVEEETTNTKSGSKSSARSKSKGQQ